MHFGLHVSIAKSIALAPERAADVNAECFQIFSRSPKGGPAGKLTTELIGGYQETSADHRLASYIHTPYFINFASARPKVRYGSINVVREELERGSQLGATALMTHLGSAKDVGKPQGVKKVISGIKKVLTGYKGTTQFLIENAAGAGQVLGDRFEEIAGMIKGIESTKALKNTVGVCFDTCHAFASGYDLRTPAAVKKTLAAFDKTIGLKRLKLIHANDSKFGLDERKDRHEHIGKGGIGLAGFKALIHHPKLKNVDMILETPQDGKELDDLKILKRLRGKR